MMSLRRLTVAILMPATLGAGVSPALAQTASPPPSTETAPAGFVVLDTYGSWRLHQTLKPPVARTADGLKPLLLKAAWLDTPTDAPGEDWTQPDFDDSRWVRGTARLVAPNPYVARLCLRGKFTAADPAKAPALRLGIDYHGGVIISVNGRELTRANVAAGAADLAEDYPAGAFLANDGGLLGFEAARRTVPRNDPRPTAIQRGIDDVEIPPAMLRPGVNVIAIEVLRAPYPGVVDEKKDPKAAFWNFAWNTCEIERVRVTAPSAGGIIPGASRPTGFRVWNSNLLAADRDLDFGDPAEKIASVIIPGARNGSFSGKVVAGNTEAIRGLKAIAGELKGQAGTIPASAVRIRYGFPWGSEDNTLFYEASPYPVPAALLGGLADRPPDEAPVHEKRPLPRSAPAGTLEPVPGVVVPVWITVNVPRDARPGTYRGTVTIRAEGSGPVPVPVELRVADFVLPNVADRRTFVEMLQSPDTLAIEYGTPPWSDRHFELIGESFRLMSDSGNRVVYVPLIAETNSGHEESMVRWVRKPDGGYDHDFSVMERYLDVAEQSLGKPRIIVFWAWDVYMSEKATPGFAGGVTAQGPVVTAWDPVAKRGERLVLPRYTDPASEALWKPLYDELRRRLEKRGVEKAMMLGMITDVWPDKADAEFLGKIAPGVGWVAHTHYYGGGPMLHKVAPVSYKTAVWTIANAFDKSLMGWKRPDLLARYWRQGGFDAFPSAQWRQLSEFAVTGNQRGTGRLGGDFWPVVRDKDGQRKARVSSRYPQSNWRNLDIYVSLLCPAPSGPAATQHYINFVEGTQEAEARIVIEQALSDPVMRQGLGDDLAGRCETVLAERLRIMLKCFSQHNNRLNGSPSSVGSTCGPGIVPQVWFAASDWESRTLKLYELAGEVSRKTVLP